MADNVSITAGSGTTISTEEVTTLNGGAVSAQHIQRITPAVRTADGTALDVTSTNPLPVNNTNGGNAQTIAANGGASVSGCTAHDAVEAGNPISNGITAVAHGASPTAVAAGDRTRWYGNRHGVPFTIGGHPNIVSTRTSFTAAQTGTVISPTVSAGAKFVTTQIQITLDNASTVFPQVRVGYSTTTTVPTTTGVLAAHGGIPAGGGLSRGDGSGILGIGADDEELRITTVGVATGNGVEVIVSGFLIES